MKLFVCLAATVVLAMAGSAQTQPPADGNASDPKAIALMRQMVTALGGEKWLAIHNVLEVGRTAGFYQGKPSGGIGLFRLLRTIPTSVTDPGLRRIEFTKKRNVIQILTKNVDWEITYKGKRQLPPEEYKEVFRRRDHSLDEAARVWWREPGTVLFFGGQKVEERRLVDLVTLLNASNDNITLQLDADTHLPVRVSFTWRDPLYKDKDEDAEEFSNFHPVEGLPTALTRTFYHNGDMTSQRYLKTVQYNVPVPPDAFNVDATTEKIAH